MLPGAVTLCCPSYADRAKQIGETRNCPVKSTLTLQGHRVVVCTLQHYQHIILALFGRRHLESQYCQYQVCSYIWVAGCFVCLFLTKRKTKSKQNHIRAELLSSLLPWVICQTLYSLAQIKDDTVRILNKYIHIFLKRNNESWGAIPCLTIGKLCTSAATRKRTLFSLRAYTSSGNPEAPW